MTTDVLAAFDIVRSLQQSTDTIFSYLPKSPALELILSVGYISATVVRTVLKMMFDKVTFDRKLQRGNAAEMVVKVSPGGKPSHLIGATAFLDHSFCSQRPRAGPAPRNKPARTAPAGNRRA